MLFIILFPQPIPLRKVVRTLDFAGGLVLNTVSQKNKVIPRVVCIKKELRKKEEELQTDQIPLYFWLVKDRKHDKAYLTRTLYLTRKLAFERVYKKVAFWF